MTHISRRAFAAGLAAAGTMAAVATPALALTEAAARALVERVVGEINQIINSGGSSSAIISQFGGVYNRYADQGVIAASILGPVARQASPAQRTAFSNALRNYLIGKYGRRFGEFRGGQVNVRGVRPAGSGRTEVVSTVDLRGSAPFEVSFFVSDRSGAAQFYDIRIEGISMLRQEQAEIGAMLDRNRGDIDALIRSLGG